MRMQAVAIWLTATTLSACAPKTTVQWTYGRDRDACSAAPTVVLAPPVIRATMPRGNVGRDMPAVQAIVATKILEIVRERQPSARLLDGTLLGAGQIGPHLSRSPVASGAVAPEESRAMSWAFEHGATHVLVPTIVAWTQMRTDDPIGAVASAHNRVTISLRLMRVQQPSGLACEVVFTNRARLTLNQPAERLLDGRFRATVLQLLSCPRQTGGDCVRLRSPAPDPS